MSKYSSAFPTVKQNEDRFDGQEGVNKREYFIAAALTGLLANPSYKLIYGDGVYPQTKDIVDYAVKVADSLCDKLYEK